jgi:hypothetical protein
VSDDAERVAQRGQEALARWQARTGGNGHDPDPPFTGAAFTSNLRLPPQDRVDEPPRDHPDRAVDGAAFILDQPPGIASLWGEGTAVLWAEGEALMTAGLQGLCKTTLAGLLLRAQLGLGDGLVLGLPVQPIDGRMLYLAMDRPRQIARSLRRQFTEADRAVLAQGLVILRGPPPADLAAQPTLLAGLADHYGADVVYVDSVKDAALRLSTDEVGAAYNRARQHLLMTGCQICELHHTVKRGPDGAPPKSIADVYGSAWLTNGCGSVILLTGEPGDPIIGMQHVKQPAGEVGPWRLLSDPADGQLTIEHQADLVDLVKVKGVDGLTARDAAAALFDTSKPTRAQKEKARRKLVNLEADEVLMSIEHDGTRAYFLAEWGCTGVHER